MQQWQWPHKLTPWFIPQATSFMHGRFTLSCDVSYATTNDLTWRRHVHITCIGRDDLQYVFWYVLSIHPIWRISSHNPSMYTHMAFHPYESFGVPSSDWIWYRSLYNVFGLATLPVLPVLLVVGTPGSSH